jgi:hypothetical protein
MNRYESKIEKESNGCKPFEEWPRRKLWMLDAAVDTPRERQFCLELRFTNLFNIIKGGLLWDYPWLIHEASIK